MAKQPRGSTRSSSPKTTGKVPKQQPFADKRPARAQRDDTPEARRQRSATPKTHPTRQPAATRKDKRRGGGGGTGAVKSLSARSPRARRQPGRRDVGDIHQMRT